MKIGFKFAQPEKHIVGVNSAIYEYASHVIRNDYKNDYYALENNYLRFPIKQLTPSFMDNVQLLKPVDYSNFINVKLDLVHSWYNPIHNNKLKAAKIITMYDLIALIYPDMLPGLYDTFAKDFRKSCNVADKIIAISESTKADIINFYGIREEKIDVVYCGLSSKIKFDYKEDISTEKYNLQEGYILSVCTLEPRKNIRGLVKGFIRFKEEHRFSKIKLVLVGKAGWDRDFQKFLLDQGRYNKDIVITGYVDDRTLSSLYLNALAVAYVSFYEGFGLPVLEAMASGCAVLCSNTSSMPEVGGDAVHYCNPADLDSISSGLCELIENDEYREQLAVKALIRSKLFTYDKAADQILDIYKQFT